MSNYPLFRPPKFAVQNPQTVDEAVSVTTGLRGPVGPPGPPGPPGEDAGSHVHVQIDASTSWLINHNLGFYPNPDVYDETGRRIRAAVIHHSINQMELQFLSPRTGTANLS